MSSPHGHHIAKGDDILKSVEKSTDHWFDDLKHTKGLTDRGKAGLNDLTAALKKWEQADDHNAMEYMEESDAALVLRAVAGKVAEPNQPLAMNGLHAGIGPRDEMHIEKHIEAMKAVKDDNAEDGLLAGLGPRDSMLAAEENEQQTKAAYHAALTSIKHKMDTLNEEIHDLLVPTKESDGISTDELAARVQALAAIQKELNINRHNETVASALAIGKANIDSIVAGAGTLGDIPMEKHNESVTHPSNESKVSRLHVRSANVNHETSNVMAMAKIHNVAAVTVQGRSVAELPGMNEAHVVVARSISYAPEDMTDEQLAALETRTTYVAIGTIVGVTIGLIFVGLWVVLARKASRRRRAAAVTAGGVENGMVSDHRDHLL